MWLDELSRHHERLKECEARVLVGMVVGAVGSQASLGEQAAEVERRTLARLGLETAPISWAPARDRFTEYALVLAMIGATLSKIGNEPVSYTHLDVYKRQPRRWAIRSSVR